jgi:hypothetical protein
LRCPHAAMPRSAQPRRRKGSEVGDLVAIGIEI